MVVGRVQRIGWAKLNVSKFFDSTCTIQRNNVDLEGPLKGGQFPCCVLAMAVGGRIEGEYTSVNSWLVHLPVGTDVQIDDYILERDRTLQVIEIASPESYEVYMYALTQRV